jgi:hypothetical protein
VAAAIIGGGSAACEAKDFAAFELRIASVANVPDAVVTQSLPAIQAIFERASISARVDTGGQPNALIITAVLVDSRTMRGTSENVLGVATESRERCGRVAYVFWDRVQEAARAARYAAPTVLAIAIAHEVGHLLLPPGSHAMTGLMQPQWHDDDFYLAAKGTLGFSNGEAQRMRDRILRDRGPRRVIP